MSAALSAISLDFAVKDWTFRSFGERRDGLRLGLRFGESSSSSTLDTIGLAIGLVRQYADNGSGVARQIELRLKEDASAIPVEILAEYVAKVSLRDTMFKIARELDQAAHSVKSFRFDDLSVDVKSFLGVLADFFKVSRKSFDKILPLKTARAFDAAPAEGEPTPSRDNGSIETAAGTSP